MIASVESPSSNALDPASFAEEIHVGLDKMLRSAAFERTERPGRFLRYLVESTLAGKSCVLKESVIGCDVFDRPSDWDPRLDPVVRQEAARLRKRIAKYYETSHEPSRIRIELPVGSYVPIFFPEATAIPQGEAPITQVCSSHHVELGIWPAMPPSGPPLHTARRAHTKARFVYLGVVAIVVCALTVSLWRNTRSHSAVSIAVIPFTNATGDPADRYFADGLTSEIAASCARFKNVRIVPASLLLSHTTQPAPDWRFIASRNAASYLLEGSVERLQDQVNMTVWLRNAETGKRLWTNSYRRSAADVSAMEASIAQSMADELHLTLAYSNAPSQHIPLEQAHDFVLKAMYEMNLATVTDNAQSQQDFRRAIAFDPEYAPAYAGLAQAIWNENIVAGRRPIMEERRKSEELWEKALQIDPTYSAAHSGLAFYALQYDWDWKRGERELQAALAANDNPGAEENYASLCLILGRRAEAARHIQRAREISPNVPNHLANLINMMMLAGDLSDAEKDSQRLLALTPKALGPKLVMAEILSGLGKEKQALRILELLSPDNPRVRMGMAAVKARAGDRGGAKRLLTSLEEGVETNRLFYYDFAVAYAAMGDAGSCVKWMKKSMNAREGSALFIRVDPGLSAMQNDSAFRVLKKQMALDW